MQQMVYYFNALNALNDPNLAFLHCHHERIESCGK